MFPQRRAPLRDRELAQLWALAGNEFGNDSSREVRRRDSLTGIAARGREFGCRIEVRHGHPVTRHADRTSPSVRELDPVEHGEPLDEQSLDAGVSFSMTVLFVGDFRTETIGRAATAE